ncbi:unnamed protein product [Closterium sp. Yama58-4]|nr:unnamed protein product [Closterium sp. Yama58-4]
MIDGGNVYRVFCAIVPLYVGIGSGFLSVRVFKILSPDQCAGVNRYIAFIALPSLVFQVGFVSHPCANMDMCEMDFYETLHAGGGRGVLPAAASGRQAPRRAVHTFLLLIQSDLPHQTSVSSRVSTPIPGPHQTTAKTDMFKMNFQFLGADSTAKLFVLTTAKTDMFKMNFQFLGADSTAKLFVLVVVLLFLLLRVAAKHLAVHRAFLWSASLFMLVSMPNTLIIGACLFLDNASIPSSLPFLPLVRLARHARLHAQHPYHWSVALALLLCPTPLRPHSWRNRVTFESTQKSPLRPHSWRNRVTFESTQKSPLRPHSWRNRVWSGSVMLSRSRRFLVFPTHSLSPPPPRLLSLLSAMYGDEAGCLIHGWQQ